MTRASAWEGHERALHRLRRSYAALPAGSVARLDTGGLDTSGLRGVLGVDAAARTAEVQGMCSYDDLVAATLPHGLVPLVVPGRRGATLGGAVAGLGVGPTSFRNGLPHESVLEMDVFTGAGAVVTARPGDDLFDAFPGSHGSLGCATRLRIELEPAPGSVAVRHVRLDDAGLLAATVEEVVGTHEHDGSRVDGLDGVACGPEEHYLALATWRSGPQPSDDRVRGRRRPDPAGLHRVRTRPHDLLTTTGYLWRWDERAPRWRGRARRPAGERLALDAAVPVEGLPALLAWWHAEVGPQPVRFCPVVAAQPSPAYPLESGTTYVSVRLRAEVAASTGGAQGRLGLAVEARVRGLGGLVASGHADLAAVRRRYDPDGRLTGFPLRPTW